jgi:RNA polymerase-binding transcription factor DksA
VGPDEVAARIAAARIAAARIAAARIAAARITAGRADAESRATALAAQVAALAEQQALTTHDDEHDPEGVTIGFERAQILGLLAGARAEVAALDRAASRLGAGVYGRCLTCGRAIPEARLEALPAAETCLDCAGTRRRRR